MQPKVINLQQKKLEALRVEAHELNKKYSEIFFNDSAEVETVIGNKFSHFLFEIDQELRTLCKVVANEPQ